LLMVECEMCVLVSGEVLPVHIEVSSLSHGKQVEDGLLAALKNIVSMISVKDLPHLSDEDLDKAALLLKELQAVIVGAQLVRSIEMFLYVSTCAVLDAVSVKFLSGELVDILQQLCRCLTGVSDLTVVVFIQADDLQACKQHLSCVGERGCIALTV